MLGVIIGLSNFWFKDNPFGNLTPQILLAPELYNLAECPLKYPLITISTFTGLSLFPIETFGSGDDISQFLIISSVDLSISTEI